MFGVSARVNAYARVEYGKGVHVFYTRTCNIRTCLTCTAILYIYIHALRAGVSAGDSGLAHGDLQGSRVCVYAFEGVRVCIRGCACMHVYVDPHVSVGDSTHVSVGGTHTRVRVSESPTCECGRLFEGLRVSVNMYHTSAYIAT